MPAAPSRACAPILLRIPVRVLRLLGLIWLGLGLGPARAVEPSPDPGVVKIEVTTFEGVHRVGSGFIVGFDGDLAYVITAAHVVLGSRETGLQFSAARHAPPVPARVIHPQAQDELGLALLAVPAAAVRAAGARALPLSAGDLPTKGQDVLLVGHSRTLGDWSWLRGPVAVHEGETFKVQTSVAEGSSGGPVLSAGQVVGIVVADLPGIADVKPVVNIRNYLAGEGVTPETGPSPAARSATASPTAPAPVKLTVRSNVPGDTVSIDGERRGATPLDLTLPPGAHLVRVEKDGYEPFETSAELRPGEPRTVKADLKKVQPKPGETFRDCADCPEMVVIPAGSFAMGSSDSEAGRYNDEGPVHTVRISAPFALGKREVTVAEFRAFVTAAGYRTEAEKDGGCYTWNGKAWDHDAQRNWRSPGFEQGDDQPVVCVSWNDARAYVEWLGKKTRYQYRLPSEFEWEYAARAGTTTARFWGEDPAGACAFANVADQSLKERFPDFAWPIHDCTDGFVYTAPVGRFKPNGFGLSDMLGNVWEWTQDCWNDAYKGAPSEGTAWIQGDCALRVSRGGSWSSHPANVRAANRIRSATARRVDYVGFRPARTL